MKVDKHGRVVPLNDEELSMFLHDVEVYGRALGMDDVPAGEHGEACLRILEEQGWTR